MKTSAVIVVDLDGTLVNSDMLVENLFLFLNRYPLKIFSLFLWLFHGKAYFKNRLADVVQPNAHELPYNQQLLNWLKDRRAAGAKLVLATASDKRIAQSIASHLGIFDEVLGTEQHNLSSHRKQAALVARFGEKGYEYVGNSQADMAVWRSASAIHVANPEINVLASAKKIGVITQIFNDRQPYLRTLIKALRAHQWTKNLLLFVPLMGTHRFLDTSLLWQGCLAFIAFSLCASSVYLLNDLLDLPHDRQHASKQNRPLAAGTLPILHALILFPLLLLAAFILSIALLPPLFSVVLAAYYTITLGYSLWIKRIVMLDVVALAMLYTIRVIAGAAAMAIETTVWILAFCIFIFLSLAFVKRYTELRSSIKADKLSTENDRGYRSEDFALLASLGSASGYISVLVLALYIHEAASNTLYRSPEWMWAACPLLLFWLSRMWLLAHRGNMNDDPVLFAIKDQVSLLTGALLAISFWLAI